jgi:hypothetical protein
LVTQYGNHVFPPTPTNLADKQRVPSKPDENPTQTTASAGVTTKKRIHHYFIEQLDHHS